MSSGKNDRLDREIREIVKGLVYGAKGLVKLALAIPAVVVSTVSREISEIATPRYRVMEDEDAIKVEIELPGVKKESLRVFVKERELYVRAERDPSISTSPPRVYRVRIELPEEVDPSGTRARYVSGLLVVELPKKVSGTQVPVE